MVSGSGSAKIETAARPSGDDDNLSGSAAFPAPADQLYIYYLQGRLDPAKTDLGKSFIGNWEEEGMSFLFFSEPSDAIVAELCGSPPYPALVDTYRMAYDQWLGETFVSFSTSRFNIRPPWENPSPGEGIEIVLDPGVVFGTGTHPTTRDCIRSLEYLFDTAVINTVLDLGAGSGLLSVVAAALGSQSVLAVDLNLLAVQTVRRNILHNCMADTILAVQGRAEQLIETPADLVVANIHYDVMKHLVQTDGFLNKKAFILSGLLRSEASDIAKRLDRLPVRILKHSRDDHIWNTFTGLVE